MHSTTAFLHREATHMKKEYVGKMIVVIISEDRGETQTAKGRIIEVFNEDKFEIVDKWGNRSVWIESNIKGYKFLGDL